MLSVTVLSSQSTVPRVAVPPVQDACGNRELRKAAPNGALSRYPADRVRWSQRAGGARRRVHHGVMRGQEGTHLTVFEDTDEAEGDEQQTFVKGWAGAVSLE
jgi:hypothetical protein